MSHIVFLLNKLTNGGAQRATAVLASKLAESGHSVRMIIVKDEPITFNVSPLVNIQIQKGYLSVKDAVDLFEKINQCDKIDLIITPMHFDLSYLVILRELTNRGFNTVAIEHASYFYPLTLNLGNVRRHFQTKLEIYKALSSVWCVNRKDAFIWTTLGAHNVCYLPNIFEPDFVDTSINVSKVGKEKKSILYVGRLQADKNVDWLIRACSKILKENNQWQLLLAGQGNQELALKKLCFELGLTDKVKFLGYCSDIYTQYKSADIFVLPSNTETFSYALAEAKSFGLPALVRNMPLNELVTKTKGHKVYTNEDEFIQELSALIECDLLRESLGKESIQSIQHAFTWKSLSNRYNQVIDKLINNGKLPVDCYEDISLSLAEEIVKEGHREIVSISTKLAKVNYPVRSKSKLRKWFGNFRRKIWNSIPKRGYFFVDWHTMPELKNNLISNISGRKYYFQTGRRSKKGWVASYFQKTSKLWVMSSETRWLKVPFKGQKRVFINHACGAFKKVGFAMDANYSKHYGNYDAVISSSPYIVEELSIAYDTPADKIYSTGLPRTDKCFDEVEKEKIRESFFKQHDELKGKKIYLFAPTFRKIGKMYVNFFNLPWGEVSKILSPDEVIIVSLHPHLANQKNVEWHSFCSIPKDLYNIKFMPEFDTYSLSVICDVFITDYSSAIFDAILLNKSVGLYSEDLTQYERGFYFNYCTEGPVVPCLSSEPLTFVSYIREVAKNKSSQYFAFKEKHLSSCDGHSTERVVELLKALLTKDD